MKTSEKIKLGIESLYLYDLGLFIFIFNNNLLPANFDDYYKNVKTSIIIIWGLQKITFSYLDTTAE